MKRNEKKEMYTDLKTNIMEIESHIKLDEYKKRMM
jgi:hypothetical protein